jgi:hypothetical protein
MRKPSFAPATFMIVFCCAYALVFSMDWPLFRYYPLHGDFNWGARYLKGAGPAMAWYGLLSGAGIIALLASIVVPDSAAQKLFRNYLWAFPCGAMLTCVFLLRQFFR